MDITVELFKSIVTQGPLVAFLFYLYIQNEKRIEKKDAENANLNKEMRGFMENQLNKAHEVTVKTSESVQSNTVAINSLREVIKNV